MTTHSALGGRSPVRDFRAVFAHARRHVASGPGKVHELELELDGAPLSARSRLLTSGDLLFIHGENLPGEDMELHHDAAAPMVAVHATLGGSAVVYPEGLDGSIAGRPGEVQLFAAPTSHSKVRLQANVRNEAFRISLARSLILGLAARHAELETLATHIASGRPFCTRPRTSLELSRLIDESTEIMNSEHYGAFRPLFLESRALGWLAMALAPSPSSSPGPPPREVDRMHAARDLLLSRLSDPPSLAEVARAVGTNDFALKRNFKRVFGQPVYGYLLAVRLAQARRMLRDTERSVKEIAAAVGYTHPNHFSTAFHRAYGVSPARYRASPPARDLI